MTEKRPNNIQVKFYILTVKDICYPAGKVEPMMSKFNDSWMECDGRELDCLQHPELYLAIGRTFSPNYYIKTKSDVSFFTKILISLKITKQKYHKAINPDYKLYTFNIPDLRAKFRQGENH